METLLLTCARAQLIIGRVMYRPDLSLQQKNDIVLEVKQATRKGCFMDAKAD
jgi:hypothetical protein